MSYAEATSVRVEVTRAEIETLLIRRGASRFAYMSDEAKAAIGFTMQNKNLRFELPLPHRSAEEFHQSAIRGPGLQDVGTGMPQPVAGPLPLHQGKDGGR